MELFAPSASLWTPKAAKQTRKRPLPTDDEALPAPKRRESRVSLNRHYLELDRLHTIEKASCSKVAVMTHLLDDLVNEVIPEGRGFSDEAAERWEELLNEAGERLIGRSASFIVSYLQRFKENPLLQERLAELQKPMQTGVGALMVRTSLVLRNDAAITPTDAQRAVLKTFLTPLFQEEIHLCFATGPAIWLRRELPEFFLHDLCDLVTQGYLKRYHPDGADIGSFIPKLCTKRTECRIVADSKGRLYNSYLSNSPLTPLTYLWELPSMRRMCRYLGETSPRRFCLQALEKLKGGRHRLRLLDLAPNKGSDTLTYLLEAQEQDPLQLSWELALASYSSPKLDPGLVTADSPSHTFLYDPQADSWALYQTEPPNEPHLWQRIHSKSLFTRLFGNPDLPGAIGDEKKKASSPWIKVAGGHHKQLIRNYFQERRALINTPEDSYVHFHSVRALKDPISLRHTLPPPSFGCLSSPQELLLRVIHWLKRFTPEQRAYLREHPSITIAGGAPEHSCNYLPYHPSLRRFLDTQEEAQEAITRLVTEPGIAICRLRAPKASINKFKRLFQKEFRRQPPDLPTDATYEQLFQAAKAEAANDQNFSFSCLSRHLINAMAESHRKRLLKSACIFVDTNWRENEHALLWGIMVHPGTGELELWRLTEDLTMVWLEPRKYCFEPGSNAWFP